MKRELRKFDIISAKSADSIMPMWVGIEGPSSSGKTLSMLRIAAGMLRVFGGKLAVIDTEAGRSLHYRDRFDFEYIEMKAPFGALDYLDAIRAASAMGTTVIGIDSMSHEHSGEGGLLDLHEQEIERLAGDDQRKADRVNALAWTRPKKYRRTLLNAMIQMKTNFILCFRANEQSKPVEKMENGEKKVKFVDMGFMPEAGRPFVYEATVNILLPAGARGVPRWESDKPGEQLLIKKPDYLADVFKNGGPLSETEGEQLARWASGPEKKGTAPATTDIHKRANQFISAMKTARTSAELKRYYNGHAGVDVRNKLEVLDAKQVLSEIDLTFEARLTELEEVQQS